MNEVFEFLQLNHYDGIVYIVGVLFAAVAIMKCVTYIAEKVGFKTKRMLEDEKQKEEISFINKELTNYKAAMDEALERSNQRYQDLNDKICQLIDGQREHNEKSDYISAMEIRFDLTSSCERAIKDGVITFKELQSIEDLYNVYHNEQYLGMNSYVTDLVMKVRKLNAIEE